MALPASTPDALLITAAEAKTKQAMTEGVAGLSDALMTPAQYTPTSPGVSPNLVRDTNRALAAGVIETLAEFPVRLPRYTISTLPLAALWTGAMVFVSNGAAGQPVVAFSDGVLWLRVDTRTAVS